MGWFPDQAGGLNRYVGDLLGALAEAGAPTRAVVVGPASGAPSNVAVAGLASDRLPRRLAAYARAAGRLAPGEVVDAHFALYALAPLLFGEARHAPLVTHFHGPWALESRSAGAGWLERTAKDAVERLVVRRAREAVVLSHAFGRLLVERHRVSPWHVNVVPPGVDLERFSPGDRDEARAQLGLPRDQWIALTLRRLVPRMGVETLLAAWSRLPREGGLLLVGGAGSLRPSLEPTAPEGTHFLGPVPEDLLPAYYRAADVVVLPSLELEGFGLVALEALASGTPVVGTDAGGLPEVLAGLAPDLVVPAGDADALARRLRSARAGTKPLPRRSEARSYAETFAWDRAASRHLEIYGRARSAARRRPLRIVYVDHTASLSGGELALARLLPALEQVDAHVVLAEDGPLVGRLAAAGISVEVMPLAEGVRSASRADIERAGRRTAGAARSTVYALALARRLRALRPDLVHTNSLKSALYGGVAGRLAGVPVVWHVRDRVAPDYLGAETTRIVRAAARRLPSTVIANSQATLSALGVDGDVIPSPVVAAPCAPGARPEFTAGVVGRIARWKGQDVFLDAFARAFPEGPERAAVVGAPLFGRDERRYEDELRLRARKLGLGDRVEFTGFVDDVQGLLPRLEMLVHCSTLPEPFGQVVAEGMAAGVPVVASRGGGVDDFAVDGVNALLVPPGDTSGLADAMRRLADEPETRAALAACGRATARRFEPDRVAGEVALVYERLTGGGGRRSRPT
jgi:glycosyltransferase involved in cell wall biosynthesis